MTRIVRGVSSLGSRVVRARALAKDGEATKALIEAHAIRTHALDDLSTTVRELATGIARRIVGQELSLRPEAIASIAEEAISKVRRANSLLVRVHPDDAKIVREMEERILAGARSTTPLTIESDTSLARGDCVVESNLGTLNARVEAQLEQFGRALELASRKVTP